MQEQIAVVENAGVENAGVDRVGYGSTFLVCIFTFDYSVLFRATT